MTGPREDAAERQELTIQGVTVALALQELDRLNAMEQLPTVETLIRGLQARAGDFNLLVGVCEVFLKGMGR